MFCGLFLHGILFCPLLCHSFSYAEVFQERLRELIEPSVLPACYGGSYVSEDGDPNCDRDVSVL